MPYTQTKWSLASLYPGHDSPELQTAFDLIEEQVTSFEGVRSKLKPETRNVIGLVSASTAFFPRARMDEVLAEFADLLRRFGGAERVETRTY